MKNLKTASAIAAVILAGGIGAAAMAKGYAGQNLASSAHVSMAKAQAIALKAHPGRITDRELEKEAGGSGLRYSFDIASGGKKFEVGVDAQSGAVLENKVEGPNPD